MEKNYTLDPKNVEQQMAFDIVKDTNTSIFVTGEAGTGKTTWTKLTQELVDKNFLVVAPTGVAAVVVGGRTINSAFRFKPEILGVDTEFNFNPSLVNFMRHVDAIIVDEVSMVRADVIDAMDRWLRLAFKSRLPFAGKQMIFVGDVFQLPPVIKSQSADSEMLADMYGEGIPFFYKANVLKRMNLPKIQFTKVYRQKDQDFIRVLNNIRVGKVEDADLAVLNKHVKPEAVNGEDFGVILTAINATADKQNRERLAALDTKEFCYDGKVEGTFEPSDSTVPQKLVLKVGAQVIFCRNDKSGRYVNGTIAQVTKLTDDAITVKLENGLEFDVDKDVWESKKKEYNREEKKIITKVVGRYTQFPIKLAWSLTVHKSQGMSLSKMVLDLSRGMFQAGQLYVALSRVRSLDGLRITNPVMPHHIRQNPEVTTFATSFNDREMILDETRIGKATSLHLANKDYDSAVQACMEIVKEKIRENDLRNASILAKRMFDMMLSDECLMGSCSDMELLKSTGMISNFLNAVICLYSGRYEESVVFADSVLQRKTCFEAMFIKARALYSCGRYKEADKVNSNIIDLFNASKEECFDKKFLWLIALVNKEVGDSNINVCKHLISLCPEHIPAYLLIRDDMQKEGKSLSVNDEEDAELLCAFNEKSLYNDYVKNLIAKEIPDKKSFERFKLAVLSLQE